MNIDVTQTVPSDLVLLYNDGSLHAKKGDTVVELNSDDLIRLNVAESELPCYCYASDYDASRAKNAIQNKDLRSAFASSAAARYTTLVVGQKVSKAQFLTKMLEVSNAIEDVANSASEDLSEHVNDGDVHITSDERTKLATYPENYSTVSDAITANSTAIAAEETRATAEESDIRTDFANADAAIDVKINFGEIVNRIWIYGNNVYDLNKMVKPGAYYCSSVAAVVGTAMTHMPSFGGTACVEGVLVVTKNTQIFIEGGTAKGRMFYRYQTGAGASVSEYTEDWTPSAKFSDVSKLETDLKAIIGTPPVGMTVIGVIMDVAGNLDTLRTAVEATVGENAISVIDNDDDAATKTIKLVIADDTLSQDADGLKCELTMKKADTAESGFAATYFLADKEGNQIGSSINLIKDQFLKNQPEIVLADKDSAPSGWAGDAYVKGHKYLKFTWELTRGDSDSDTDYVTYLDVNEMFDSYTGTDALIVDNSTNKISLKIKNTTVVTGDNESTLLLYQDTQGIKVQGVQAGINYAVGIEKTRAEGAEADLQSAIDTLSSTVTADVSSEAASREAEDTAIRSELSAGLNTKVTRTLDTVTGGKAIIFNEADGGGAKIEKADGRWVFVGVNDGSGSSAEENVASIYSVKKNTDGKFQGLRLVVMNDKITYVPDGLLADNNEADRELAVKADITDALTTADEKDAAVYTTVTSDIATAKSALESSISAEESARKAADNTKVDIQIATPNGGRSLIFNESDGGGAKIEQADGRWIFSGVNNGNGSSAEENVASIYSVKKNGDGKYQGLRFVVTNSKITYVPNGLLSDCNAADREIAVLADVNKKVTREVATATMGKSLIFNEADGGGAKIEQADGRWIFVGVNDGDGSSAEQNVASIYSLMKNNNGKFQGLRFVVMNDKITYVPNGLLADNNDASRELAVKADVDAVNFGTLINKINRYDDSTANVGKMVKPGLYFVATSAARAGIAMTGLPMGDCEGILLVTKNSQVFIEGGTAKGRMFYRYQTGAGDNVSEYTEEWTAAAMMSDIEDHTARNTIHTAEVKFIRTATTVTNMEYKRYICSKALTGTLPANASDGTERIVSVVSGGEGTTVLPATGDKIEGSTSGVAINVSNDTVHFFYDATAKNWLIL